MTEAYEDGWLVRVRAQVMCRDEGTGGWVALDGGGLANVMVGKRRAVTINGAGSDNANEDSARPSHAHAHNYEYFIHGVRITDDTEVLSCTIKKDFEYNKVMPTFHHWVTDEQRFGLTFQTAADARAFDRGVRTAIIQLLDGLGGAWPSLHKYKNINPGPKEDDEENNIFECLDLPHGSRSSSENSTASRPHRGDIQTPILSAISQSSPHHTGTCLKQYGLVSDDDKHGIMESNPDHCPYVHLKPIHDYTYPQLGPAGVISSEKSSPHTKPPLLKRDSGSLKKHGVCSYSGGPPPLPEKKHTKPSETFQARLRCRYCSEWYLESANRAGACESAPECCMFCVDAITCSWCAKCMTYHCFGDSEGDFAKDACTCNPSDDKCAKRWIGLALLSILVPCLCCYAPLRCAQRASRAAHIAGGQHSPSSDMHA